MTDTSIAAGWLEAGPDAADTDALRPVDLARESAADLVAQLTEGGRAVAVCCPGNGTQYVIVAVALSDDEAKVCGGEHLIALPAWRSSAVLTLGPDAIHTPDYIGSRMNLGRADAAVVASILTLASARL